MKLDDLQKNWDAFGRIDPLWAILTAPEKIHRKWELSEFFKTGAEEIETTIQQVEALQFPIGGGLALDFGCGVGRLTQALCPHFNKTFGLDIAPSMIRRAKKYNRYGPKCEYLVNDTGDLSRFPDASFDFIYSSLVLQHIEPTYSKKYIREFLRLLAPGGILVFQLPAELRKPDRDGGAKALPDAAFKAGIYSRIKSFTSSGASTGEIRVTVTNLSLVAWPRFQDILERPIALGNHWLNANGECVAWDDARTLLDREVKPAEKIELALNVTVPERPGEYILQLDMVQEFVTWFARKGSSVTEIRVTATGPENASSADPALAVSHGVATPFGKGGFGKFRPKMEMYGVPEAEIAEMTASCGAELVKAQPDESGGPEWVGFRYFITKPRTALLAKSGGLG